MPRGTPMWRTYEIENDSTMHLMYVHAPDLDTAFKIAVDTVGPSVDLTCLGSQPGHIDLARTTH